MGKQGSTAVGEHPRTHWVFADIYSEKEKEEKMDGKEEREEYDIYVSDRVIYAVEEGEGEKGRDASGRTGDKKKKPKFLWFGKKKKKEDVPATAAAAPPPKLGKLNSTWIHSPGTFRHDSIPDIGGPGGPYPFWYEMKNKEAKGIDLVKRVVRVVERVLEMTVHRVRTKPYTPPSATGTSSSKYAAFDLVTAEELGLLCTVVSRYILLSEKKALVHVDAPAKVYGDIHGQIVDLIQFFRSYGAPSHRSGDVNICNYIFDGDFVDRGAYSLEVLTVLLCLKIRYHPRVTLLRGNHEARMANHLYGFQDEIKARLANGDDKTAEKFYDENILPLFVHLPFAALVQKKILCVHGGIGLHVKSLGQIESIPIPYHGSTWRFSPEATPEAETQNVVVDLLWSDPHPTNRRGLTCETSLKFNAESRDAKTAGWSGPGFNDQRNTGSFFGPDVVEAFCRRNNIDMIVRAHMCVRGGMQLDGKRCITVFSAPRYGNHDNAGALLEISRELNMQFKALAASDSKSQWANSVNLDVFGKTEKDGGELLRV